MELCLLGYRVMDARRYLANYRNEIVFDVKETLL